MFLSPLSTRSVYVPPEALSCKIDKEDGDFVSFKWDDLSGEGDKTLRVEFDVSESFQGLGGLLILEKSGRDITFHRSRRSCSRWTSSSLQRLQQWQQW